MGVSIVDRLRSSAEARASARVRQDVDRANARPSWLPDDWPDGVPYVALVGRPEDRGPQGRIERVVAPGEVDDGPLTDAQRAGLAAELAILRNRA